MSLLRSCRRIAQRLRMGTRGHLAHLLHSYDEARLAPPSSKQPLLVIWHYICLTLFRTERYLSPILVPEPYCDFCIPIESFRVEWRKDASTCGK